MWFYALVQRLRSGKVVALRHKEENVALGGIRGDMQDAWMFSENSEEQHPGTFMYVIRGDGMKITGMGIEQVPDEVIAMLSPPILVELAA